MRTTTSQRRLGHPPAWRDMALVVIATLFGGWLAAYFELSESIFAWTRGFERWQLDELLALLTVLSVGLAWFAWRRYRVARVELMQRRAAESRLEKLLLDNRRFARQFLHLQESERKSLARELHDELGQYLNAVKIDAVSMQQRVDPGSPMLRPASAIIEHIDHISAVVRDLIGELRPVGLDELGLKAALEHCVGNWRQRLPHVHFEVALAGDLDSLDEAVALTIYRLVQEGLTNVSKHAQARRVDIHVRRIQNEVDDVVFSIVDDGDGADLSIKSPGLGLVGMRERVEMLGGRLELLTTPGHGFTIRTALPAMQAP
jgi:two-component system, NarL family, sensor histidine kinase UhpB